VVVFVVVRYVVPPARRAMAAQQQAVAKQVEEAKRSGEELVAAENESGETLEAARTEAAKVRDRARAEADYISDELAGRAEQDVARIQQRGEEQLDTQRKQTVRQLRRDVGQLAIQLAGRIVNEALTDESRRAATVDRVLDELQGMSQSEPSPSAAPSRSRQMQGVSRESLTAAQDRLDTEVDGSDEAGLTTLGEELFSVAGLLTRERSLLRTLADPAIADEARGNLVDGMLGAQLSSQTVSALRELVRARWSQPGDLLDAVDALGREALLRVAEIDGSLDQVEDEVFRFGRILDGDTRLDTLLSDASASAERRLALLDAVVADKVRPTTLKLLQHTVRAPRGRSLHVVLEELAGVVAARRERSIARVSAPAPLSGAQQQRLGSVLADIYGRQVSLQIEIDESLLGGLIVRVGEDLIDGSVAAQLERARQGLPQ
jgi:F-type H+-transporting ATPase subunit delta